MCSVSYTHLDVYKRQFIYRANDTWIVLVSDKQAEKS